VCLKIATIPTTYLQIRILQSSDILINRHSVVYIVIFYNKKIVAKILNSFLMLLSISNIVLL
jgi:hypothetical protein